MPSAEIEEKYTNNFISLSKGLTRRKKRKAQAVGKLLGLHVNAVTTHISFYSFQQTKAKDLL